MADQFIYTERIKSNKTEALFLALMMIFFLLFIWRAAARGLDILAVISLCLSSVFLFYSLNYRTLVIRLTVESLRLTFGIFSWVILFDNIDDCRLDDLPTLARMGGAGIHFMFIRNRYRASFNFLEYPRVVIELIKKVGPVRDVSFSTHRPDEILRLIQDAIPVKTAT